jgi:hypothetical protein
MKNQVVTVPTGRRSDRRLAEVLEMQRRQVAT